MLRILKLLISLKKITSAGDYSVENLRLFFSWKRKSFMIKGNIMYPLVDIRKPNVIEGYSPIEQIWNTKGININNKVNFKAPNLNYEHFSTTSRKPQVFN